MRWTELTVLLVVDSRLFWLLYVVLWGLVVALFQSFALGCPLAGLVEVFDSLLSPLLQALVVDQAFLDGFYHAFALAVQQNSLD